MIIKSNPKEDEMNELLNEIKRAKEWKRRFALFPTRVSPDSLIWLQMYEHRNPDPMLIERNVIGLSYVAYGVSEFRYKNKNEELTISSL